MAKRFYVHFLNKGTGCDYTVGCGEKLVRLPPEITTMQEAIHFVEYPGDDHKGQILYHGSLEDFESVQVLEAEVHYVDLCALRRARDKDAAKEETARKEATERALYEQLRAKFG